MKEHAPSRSSGSARVSRCPDRSRQPSSQLLLRQRRVSASDPPRDHRPLYRQLYRMKARDGPSADRQTLGVHDEQRHYRNDHRRCGGHHYRDRNSPVDLTNFCCSRSPPTCFGSRRPAVKIGVGALRRLDRIGVPVSSCHPASTAEAQPGYTPGPRPWGCSGTSRPAAIATISASELQPFPWPALFHPGRCRPRRPTRAPGSRRVCRRRLKTGQMRRSKSGHL